MTRMQRTRVRYSAQAIALLVLAAIAPIVMAQTDSVPTIGSPDLPPANQAPPMPRFTDGLPTVDPVPRYDPNVGWEMPYSTDSRVHAVFEPGAGYTDAFRYWVQPEYLLGWVRQAPAPLPLVTTGDAKNKSPGAIGQPGTVVQFGNAGIGFRVASGLRLTMGEWIDPEHTFAIDGAGYGFERRPNNFTLASDNTGKPLLATPFVNTTAKTATESAHVVSSPGATVGSILIASGMQRWGSDVNIVWCFWRRPGLEFSVLGGIRYEELHESMEILQSSFTLASKTNTNFDDQFATGNQFVGAQIGGRMHWQQDVWTLDMTAKVALGNTHQYVDVQGVSSQFGPKVGAAGTFPGGLYAQPSNVGRTTANTATALPSFDAKIGYQLTPRCRVFVGYEILYWNQVVRPGDQIDRNINLTQSKVLGATNGTLVGPAVPTPLFERRGFWAQDVSVGLEFRF